MDIIFTDVEVEAAAGEPIGPEKPSNARNNNRVVTILFMIFSMLNRVLRGPLFSN
jgi:hypothetical protein